jgi:hypothetical protein
MLLNAVHHIIGDTIAFFFAQAFAKPANEFGSAPQSVSIVGRPLTKN